MLRLLSQLDCGVDIARVMHNLGEIYILAIHGQTWQYFTVHAGTVKGLIAKGCIEMQLGHGVPWSDSANGIRLRGDKRVRTIFVKTDSWDTYTITKEGTVTLRQEERRNRL